MLVSELDSTSVSLGSNPACVDLGKQHVLTQIFGSCHQKGLFVLNYLLASSRARLGQLQAMGSKGTFIDSLAVSVCTSVCVHMHMLMFCLYK